MDEKVILAALEEMKIHALRFTMEDLTKRLHMSKTSLYKIVDTKEKLIHEILNYLMKSFEEEEKIIREETKNAQEKVTRFVDEYTRVFNFLESGAYDDLKNSYPNEWQLCEKFRQHRIEVLLQFINEGMTKGEFRQVNSAVLQYCLLIMSSMLANKKFLSENDLTYSQAIASMKDLIFHGILK